MTSGHVARNLGLAQVNGRCRRGNRILKRAWHILKRCRKVHKTIRWIVSQTYCFSRATSREVQVRGRPRRCVSGSAPVSRYGGQQARSEDFSESARQPQTAVRSGDAGACQRTVPSRPGQLRQAADDRSAERAWLGRLAPTHWGTPGRPGPLAADPSRRGTTAAEVAVQTSEVAPAKRRVIDSVFADRSTMAEVSGWHVREAARDVARTVPCWSFCSAL